jgi:hypothetical protein
MSGKGAVKVSRHSPVFPVLPAVRPLADERVEKNPLFFSNFPSFL